MHEPSLGQIPSPTSQIQPQQLLHKTDVIAIMGTVKLNRGVLNADTRWTLAGTPRILLETSRIVQHSPSLESRGSDALDEGVTLGLRKRHSRNPLGVRLCDACDTCDGSFGALSASVGRGFRISFSVLIARSSSKLPVTPVTRVTKPCAARVLGVTVPKASRHSRHWKRHSLIPARPPAWLASPVCGVPCGHRGP